MEILDEFLPEGEKDNEARSLFLDCSKGMTNTIKMRIFSTGHLSKLSSLNPCRPIWGKLMNSIRKMKDNFGPTFLEIVFLFYFSVMTITTGASRCEISFIFPFS